MEAHSYQNTVNTREDLINPEQLAFGLKTLQRGKMSETDLHRIKARDFTIDANAAADKEMIPADYCKHKFMANIADEESDFQTEFDEEPVFGENGGVRWNCQSTFETLSPQDDNVLDLMNSKDY